MNIKKFTAPTMTEALAKVRDELGPDAIILNTRSNRKGSVFDFLGNTFVEVTAAVDNKVTGNTKGYSGSARSSASGTSVAAGGDGYKPVSPRRTDNVRVKTLGERADVEGIMDDIKELKKSIKVLADTALTGDLAGLPEHLATLLVSMQASGYDDKIAKRVTRQLLNELSGSELADISVIREKATKLLVSSMGNVCPVIFAGSKPRIVAFVGPTGTGKTTTIAKLATEFLLNMNKKVSVLSIDTKRVDAVGQLKSFCRIIDVPLFVAYHSR